MHKNTQKNNLRYYNSSDYNCCIYCCLPTIVLTFLLEHVCKCICCYPCYNELKNTKNTKKIKPMSTHVTINNDIKNRYFGRIWGGGL